MQQHGSRKICTGMDQVRREALVEGRGATYTSAAAGGKKGGEL
jgi:hypothetical protein